MKRAILHIGIHKTGTTSIQEWCYDNRHLLQDRTGWTYPSELTVQKAHHVIPWSVMEKFEANPVSRPHRGPLNEIRQLLAGHDNLLISTEPLCTADNDDLAVIADLFQDFEVTVLIYVRRQDKLIQSDYVQRVKQDVFPLTDSFPEFANNWRRRVPAIDYAKLASRWAKHFHRVMVLDFDSSARTGIVRSFLTVLGAEALAPSKEEPQNVSLNFHLVAAQRELNILDQISPGIRARLIDIVSAHPYPTGQFSFFEGRGAIRFFSQFEDSNAELLQFGDLELGKTFDQYPHYVTPDRFVDTQTARYLEWFSLLAKSD